MLFVFCFFLFVIAICESIHLSLFCLLLNIKHTHLHIYLLITKIYLFFFVIGNLPDTPMATYRPHDQYIELGKSARLYCEAFVGKVKLPDARSSILWYQVFDDEQEQNVDGIQKKVTREDDQIVGALLIIPELKLHNYGRYICRTEIGNSAHRLEMSVWLFGSPMHAPENPVMPALVLALGAVVLIILLMFFIKYLSVCIAIRQRRDKKLFEMHATETVRIREVL